MAEFSDYIVYVDESGDHSLDIIDQQFPVFALSFCVVRKHDYVNSVVPAVQKLKFKYWGHDAVVLHEHEIRKSKGDFAWLPTDREKREAFLEDLHQVVEDAPVTLIGSVIDKNSLRARYSEPRSPYDLALRFCLERLLRFLLANGQRGRHIHVVFEYRGKAEDKALNVTFGRIVRGEDRFGNRKHEFGRLEFEPKFAKKSANSAGLQLADLTARPMARLVLQPDRRNRTYTVLRSKLYKIKVFP